MYEQPSRDNVATTCIIIIFITFILRHSSITISIGDYGYKYNLSILTFKHLLLNWRVHICMSQNISFPVLFIHHYQLDIGFHKVEFFL